MDLKQSLALCSLALLFGSIGIFILPHAPLTGYAIKEEAILPHNPGFYSIYPHFNTKVDYTLNVYTSIKQSFSSLKSCVEQGGSIDTCMRTVSTADLHWSGDCNTGVEKLFYDIAEFYQECMNTQDTNCFCRYSLAKTSQDISRLGLEGSYTFSFTESNDRSTITMLLKEPQGALAYALSPSGAYTWAPSTMSISYGKETQGKTSLIFHDQLAGQTHSIENPHELVLYKTQDTSDKKEVVFLKFADGNFQTIGATPSILSKKQDCILPQKQIQRFCVTQTNKQFLVHDKLTNTVSKKPVVIKFASTLPDTPPGPVQNIKVQDAPRSSKAVVVSWDASSAADTMRYRIYRGDAEVLASTATKDLVGKASITSFSVAEALSLDALPSFENCAFNTQAKKCAFLINGQQKILESGKLYTASVDGKTRLFVILPVEHDGVSSFSVTALDASGNEIDNVKATQKMPIVSGESRDDLPLFSERVVPALVNLGNYYNKETKEITFPSFSYLTAQKVNIDGTAATDFKDIVVLYTQSSSKPTADSLLSVFEGQVMAVPQGDTLIVPMGEPGQAYYLIVVARDQLDNPQKSSVTVREIGATVLELAIP